MELIAIPGYDDTYINSNSEVFVGGVLKSTYVNGDGYHGVAVKQNNRWVTVGLQRLVALAFCKEELGRYLASGYNINDLEANHIDLDKTNNAVSNIEWCTSKENNIHAYIASDRMTRPTIYIADMESIITDTFLNLKECAEWFKLPIIDVWRAIKWGTMLDDYYVCHIPVKGRVPGILRKNRKGIAPREAAVQVKNIETGNISKYTNSRTAAFYMTCPPSLITTMKSTVDNVRFIYGKYIVTDLNVDIDALDISGVSDAQKVKGLGCTASKNGKTQTFKSIKNMNETLGLSRKAVYTRLGKSNKCEVDGWKIELL